MRWRVSKHRGFPSREHHLGIGCMEGRALWGWGRSPGHTFAPLQISSPVLFAQTSPFLLGKPTGPARGGLPAPPGAWGCWGLAGIKSSRENILQQVQLATGLNGCQPALKSRAHLRSSVGHQMGPASYFGPGLAPGGAGATTGSGCPRTAAGRALGRSHAAGIPGYS